MFRFAIALLLPLAFSCSTFADDTSPSAAAAVCFAYAAIQADAMPLVVPSEKEERPEEPISYRDAYALYKSERKPMVVMVTASWCPYCPAVKRELLKLQEDGKLASASLVVVDYDADRATARTVMGTQRTLPALAVFHYVSGKPRQSRPAKANEVTKILAE